MYLDCGSLLSVGHDLFLRGGGLGLMAWRILQHLDPDEGQSAQDLAAALTVKPASVRPALRRMRALGMCSRDEDGHWRILPFDPDEVAARIGTAGKAVKQRERHQREAQQRQEDVERWREAELRAAKATPEVDPTTGEILGRANGRGPVEARTGPLPTQGPSPIPMPRDPETQQGQSHE